MTTPHGSITTSTTLPSGRTTNTTTFATPTAATPTTTIMPLEENAGLSHLLSSNTVPKICEAAFVQLQIDCLTSQISRLCSQLEELEDQLRLHRAVLSPVRKIPSEILGEIFTLVLPDEHSSTNDRDMLTELQLVCRTWRDAARLEHRLWGSLYINFWDVDSLNPKKIEQWFMRSGRTPRSLTVYVPAHDLEGCETQCQLYNPDLADLLAKGESLDTLSVSYSHPQCFQNLLLSLKAVDAPLVHRPWDSLRSLTCIFDDVWTESSDPSESIFLSLPSSVTSFSLHLPPKDTAFPFDSDSDSATTPLNIPAKFLGQLTSFSLTSDWEGVKWLECTLPFCTSVEKLTLDFGGSYWRYDPVARDIEQWKRAGFLLPKVRVLCLRGVLYSMDILFFLKTPRLVELDISHRGYPDERNCGLDDYILGFVKKSGCEASLRNFRLRHLLLHPDQVYKLAFALRSLPFLTHLTLEAVNPAQVTGDDIFQLLHEGDEPSLPHLEVLELLECGPEVRHYNLISFLRSRRPFSMKNQKPSFEKPPDTLKALIVTYRSPERKPMALDEYQTIQILNKWCGVSVHIGPRSD